MAIVTPTDRPKLDLNRCVVEVFGDVFVLSGCVLDFSVGLVVFVIGLGQNSSFFPYTKIYFLTLLAVRDKINKHLIKIFFFLDPQRLTCPPIRKISFLMYTPNTLFHYTPALNDVFITYSELFHYHVVFSFQASNI